MDHRPLIDGVDLLLKVFGAWPSFREAQVVRLTLDRQGSGESGPTLEAWIHLLEGTGGVDADGPSALRIHALAHLAFHGVASLGMGGWCERNALSGLRIADASQHRLHGLDVEVEFVGTSGVNAGFVCRRVEIRSVEPCAPDGSRLLDREAM